MLRMQKKLAEITATLEQKYSTDDLVARISEFKESSRPLDMEYSNLEICSIYGIEESSQYAMLEENMEKNRYSNVLPCIVTFFVLILDDKNKVVLDSYDGKSESTYINASWCPVRV